MEEKKTLYRLEDYWVKTLLRSAKLLGVGGKNPTDLRDFVHIGDDIYIDVEEILGWVENLNYELEHQIDEYRDLENDLESNYKPIPPSDMYEVYDHDFI